MPHFLHRKVGGKVLASPNLAGQHGEFKQGEYNRQEGMTGHAHRHGTSEHSHEHGSEAHHHD